MKKFLNTYALFMLTLLVGVVAFAQDAAQTIPAPSVDDFTKFLASIGGLKGAGSLAIAAAVVQGLLLFFRSSFAKFAGIYQLLIVNGLTLVAGSIALKLSGLDWASVLLHSQTLAMAQVFMHQVWNQIQKKPADQAK